MGREVATVIWLDIIRDYGPSILLVVVASEIRLLRSDIKRFEADHTDTKRRVLSLERLI